MSKHEKKSKTTGENHDDTRCALLRLLDLSLKISPQRKNHFVIKKVVIQATDLNFYSLKSCHLLKPYM